MHERKRSLPKRSRKYGVGKEIGGAVYVHREYEQLLGSPVSVAKRALPPDFEYVVTKYHAATGKVSFIESPDFDTNPEPTVGKVCTVTLGGGITVRGPAADPYIYHHKWLFVADDYPGFDVDASKDRSAAWMRLPEVDTRRIGRLGFWQEKVLPRLNQAPD